MVGILGLFCLFFSLVVTHRTFLDVRRWFARRLVIMVLISVVLTLIVLHYLGVGGAFWALLINAGIMAVYVLVWDFYAGIAAAILKARVMETWVVAPIKWIMILYVLGIMCWALVEETSISCRHLAWKVFAISQYVLCFAFLIVGYLIFRKLDSMKIFATRLDQKKRQMWVLIISNFLCSSINFAYEIIVFVASDDRLCDSFTLNMTLDTSIFLIQRICTFLLPLLIISIVFNNWPSPANVSLLFDFCRILEH